MRRFASCIIKIRLNSKRIYSRNLLTFDAKKRSTHGLPGPNSCALLDWIDHGLFHLGTQGLQCIAASKEIAAPPAYSNMDQLSSSTAIELQNRLSKKSQKSKLYLAEAPRYTQITSKSPSISHKFFHPRWVSGLLRAYYDSNWSSEGDYCTVCVSSISPTLRDCPGP